VFLAVPGALPQSGMSPASPQDHWVSSQGLGSVFVAILDLYFLLVLCSNSFEHAYAVLFFYFILWLHLIITHSLVGVPILFFLSKKTYSGKLFLVLF
jgi:hypothetical protein